MKFDDTAAVIEGEGPPVILVHGMGLNRCMWVWQLPTLTPRFRVVRYDLLGHGDSDKPVKTYGMDDFVDQLARLMDALKVARCALVGFSLGGLIVQAFTLAHPDRVSALAILNAGHDRSDAERAGMLARLDQATRFGHVATVDAALERWFSEEFAARRPDVLDCVRRWMTATDPEVYPLIYRVLVEGDRPLAGAIAAIRCPTLVLACALDHGNSPAMARRMAALIPGARAEIVSGLKHMGLAENPDAIARILGPFLEDALATARTKGRMTSISIKRETSSNASSKK
jgi:pimeloyl-ACP methyl ester carboxylesterase